MKSHSLFSRYELAAQGLFLGFLLLTGIPARAQILYNPGFEAPISTNWSQTVQNFPATTNWMVTYVSCGPDDFCMHDRSTFKGSPAVTGGSYVGHFRPIHEGVANAYFSQTVTNLLPGTNYIVSGYYMNTMPGFTGPTPSSTNKMNVFVDLVGGQGTHSSAACTASISTWAPFSVTNTANGGGKLEIRLRYWKPVHTIDNDYKGILYSSGCFDDISLTQQ